MLASSKNRDQSKGQEQSKSLNHSKNRDKDIRMIKIKVEHCAPLEQIEEKIREKLRTREVQDFLCNPGDEVMLVLTSEGP